MPAAEGLVLEAGAVVVPPALANTVFCALVLYARDHVRDGGGSLAPEAADLLRALHKAAEGPAATSATSSEGSPLAPTTTLGARDVAQVLGCSRRWATFLLSSGRLDAWRVGRTWVTTAASLDRHRYGTGETDARPTGPVRSDP
ncbi:helix-turn-helix domain-containing protein [Streptomyces chryseus]